MDLSITDIDNVDLSEYTGNAGINVDGSLVEEGDAVQSLENL
jgi:hypothetical protein